MANWLIQMVIDVSSNTSSSTFSVQFFCLFHCYNNYRMHLQRLYAIILDERLLDLLYLDDQYSKTRVVCRIWSAIFDLDQYMDSYIRQLNIGDYICCRVIYLNNLQLFLPSIYCICSKIRCPSLSYFQVRYSPRWISARQAACAIIAVHCFGTKSAWSASSHDHAKVH